MTKELNPEPEKEACGPTHYAGCACHEKEWENKWRAAVEMAAEAQLERDELRAAIRAYRDAKGRYHTQKACERLLTFLPENASALFCDGVKINEKDEKRC